MAGRRSTAAAGPRRPQTCRRPGCAHQAIQHEGGGAHKARGTCAAPGRPGVARLAAHDHRPRRWDLRLQQPDARHRPAIGRRLGAQLRPCRHVRRRALTWNLFTSRTITSLQKTCNSTSASGGTIPRRSSTRSGTTWAAAWSTPAEILRRTSCCSRPAHAFRRSRTCWSASISARVPRGRTCSCAARWATWCWPAKTPRWPSRPA